MVIWGKLILHLVYIQELVGPDSLKLLWLIKCEMHRKKYFRNKYTVVWTLKSIKQNRQKVLVYTCENLSLWSILDQDLTSASLSCLILHPSLTYHTPATGHSFSCLNLLSTLGAFTKVLPCLEFSPTSSPANHYLSLMSQCKCHLLRNVSDWVGFSNIHSFILHLCFIV